MGKDGGEGLFDAIAEYMRVAAYHFCGNRLDHGGEIEIAGFLGHLRVKHDLEQQVAQFVLERRHIVVIDGVGDFIGFLDGMGKDGGEGLFDVPRATAVGITQPRHDIEQFLDIFTHAGVGPGQGTG